MPDDSYDTPSAFESLQYKLRIPFEQSTDLDLAIKSKGAESKKTISKTDKENEFHSPRNLSLKSKPKVRRKHDLIKENTPGADSDLEDIFCSLSIDDSQTKTKSKKPTQVVTKSFLASLSVDLPEECRHADAVPYVRSFRKLRTELTLKLFTLFNQTIFQNQLPQDFSLTWNKRLTRTAGLCYCN